MFVETDTFLRFLSGMKNEQYLFQIEILCICVCMCWSEYLSRIEPVVVVV